MSSSSTLRTIFLSILMLAAVAGTAAAQGPTGDPAALSLAPDVAACTPGSSYAPGCDVDQDGDIDIVDIQRTAGRWNTTGPYTTGHNHLGESWIGSGNPLTIGGSFGVDSAGLILNNTNANGAALRVDASANDGVRVAAAGTPGGGSVTISTMPDGVEVDYAEGRGLWVGRAGAEGLVIWSAGRDGIYMRGIGSPQTDGTESALHNGLEIRTAEGNGVYVSHSDQSGLYVAQSDLDGVHVASGGINGGYFETPSENGNGIQALANNGTAAYAVWGRSTNGYAGFFSGKVHVSGTLSKDAGGFKIDHPLNPAKQYLYHSFVESPDMKNVYDGVVTLDAAGEAVVQLPDWFEALNSDYRYQLTCIGGYAPVYISEEIADNRFTIAGGTRGLKVSWQVTGIRQDAYARENRIPVEEDKPGAERDTYLYPEGFGQPASRGLESVLKSPQSADMMEAIGDEVDSHTITIASQP